MITFIDARSFIRRNHGGTEETMLKLVDALEERYGAASLGVRARKSTRAKFTCLCGEKRREEFRESEPMRCKACRRAYNAKRKKELR